MFLGVTACQMAAWRLITAAPRDLRDLPGGLVLSAFSAAQLFFLVLLASWRFKYSSSWRLGDSTIVVSHPAP
jgi:hypothetical protein